MLYLILFATLIGDNHLLPSLIGEMYSSSGMLNKIISLNLTSVNQR